jgi:hypothetical protein
MAGYTRQSTAQIVSGEVISAAPVNAELNQVLAAFNESTGHSHDGTAAEGPPIDRIGDADQNNKVLIDTTNNYVEFYTEVSSSSVQQLYIADGAIVPVTDNDIDLGTASLEFKDVFVDGTAHIDTLDIDENATIAGTLGVTGALTGSSTVQGTTITATTAFVPDANDGAALGTTSLEFSDLYLADGAVVGLGNDQDVTLTHVADTGILLNSTNKIQFNDASQFIQGSSATVLALGATDEIDLTATAIDINGTVDMSSTLAVTGAVTADAGVSIDNITIDGTEIDLSSGDLTVDVAGDIILDAGGDEVIFKDGSTNVGHVSMDSDNLTIKSLVSDKDMIFQGNDGGSGITALTLDMSGAGAATFNSSVTATALSVGDGNITNVGDIALDSISADDTDINVAVTDNSATAFTIKQGSDAYLIVDTADSSESVSIGTGISGTAITIGHGTSEVTIGDNLTVSGNLTVNGTQTVVDTVTMNAANAIVFEGATADAHETTLSIVDPTADHTQYLINQGGYIPVLDTVTTTAISATPAELNIMDGVTASTAELNIMDGVTATTTELNLMDGGSTVGTTAIADGDGLIINDAGTMRQATVQTLAAYLDDEITAMPNLVTTGALDGGSISSGFGAIDNGSSNITTTGTISFGSLTDGTITATAFVDEDDMTSNSATLIPTQQSVKAYVDSNKNVSGLNATGAELNTVADASAISIDTSTAIANNDAILMYDNSATAMKYFDVDLLDTYYASSTQTLSNKTLTAPKIVDGGFIADANGNEGIVLQTASSAVNAVEVTNSATGGSVVVGAMGDDSNIDIDITPKGTGEVNIAAGNLNYAGTAVTSTGAELNILDGVTSTTAELNKLDGYNGTVTELNYLKDLYDTGVTNTEFDYLDGVTSNVQTQLNATASTGKAIAMSMVFG